MKMLRAFQWVDINEIISIEEWKFGCDSVQHYLATRHPDSTKLPQGKDLPEISILVKFYWAFNPRLIYINLILCHSIMLKG